MKSIRLFLLLILALYSHSSFCQNSEKNRPIFNKKKLTISVGALSAGTVGAYFYAKNTWWSDQATNFHFDQGADLIYAMNVDKASHFFGGFVSAEMFMRLWDMRLQCFI